MMSCRLKAFMVLAFWALAQSVSSKLIRDNLLDPNSPDKDGLNELSAINEDVFINVTALVSIPPSENGSAQILSSVLTMSENYPCLFTIIADEIEPCKNSSNTSDSCQSVNKEPELIVTLIGVVNYAKTYTYTAKVTGGALVLTIYMEDALVIKPKYYQVSGDTKIYLNFQFQSFQNIDKRANTSDVFVNVQTLYIPSIYTTPGHNGQTDNGQTGLCPLNGTILLMLLAVFLIN